MKKIVVLLMAFILCFSAAGMVWAGEDGVNEVSGMQGMIFQPDAAVVSTNAGQLRGYIEDGIYTFKGIPYAQAERFQEPQPMTWEGIRNAQIYAGQAPQAVQTASLSEALMPHLFWPTVADEKEIQSMNIWTPGLEGKRPVMVWLHGGAFSTGAAYEQICFDGRFMAERGDVVLVSINHRLNCLGYLDLSAFGEEYANSGNLGQMDMVAALQWVHDNIEAFGGDPENVTIFGQSGGGRKVLNLMATPAAKGLFHKAIGESCGQMSIPQDVAQKIGVKTLELLGAESVEEIKDIPYTELVEAADAALAAVNEEEGSRYQWCPVAGGDWMPKDIWLEGNLTDESIDVPLLIGTTFSEFGSNAMGFGDTGEPVYKNAFTDEEADAYLTDKYGEAKDDIVAEFLKAYPNKKPIDAAFVDAFMYRPSVKSVVEMKAAQGGAPVYNYMFIYEFPTMGGWLPYHCAELPFVWHNLESEKLTVGTEPEAYALADMMCDAWTSFARTGDPNHEGMPQWPAWTPEEGAVMMFDAESYVAYHHDDLLLDAIRGASSSGQSR